MTAKSILEGMKFKCELDGFEIFTGWGLDFEDFEQGKMIETGGLKPKSICITHDGFRPLGINENSTHSKVVAMVTVFLKTNEEPEYYVNKLIEMVNNDNNLTAVETPYLIQFTGAVPIIMEKNNYVFMIDFEIN